MPRTRIVCTLGPATTTDERIAALIRAGMNVARVNFSHGTLDDHARRMDTVRRMAAAQGAVVALLGDLSGPKLRVGEIQGGSVSLRPGELVNFELAPTAPAPAIPLDFAFLADALKPGDHMLLDDGTKEVEVIRAASGEIQARVIAGGVLTSRKGVNLPNTSLPIPSLTDRDRQNAEWAIAQGIDYLALSFVRRAADVIELRQLVRSHHSDVPIIAKIEKPEAVKDFDAILHESDGIMVARGDLGVEMPAEQVPIVQKLIIAKANADGKPVITATQMLESMINNPRPTRAEASDVANAVLDGTDAVMLSGETAVGTYPIEAVTAMAHIADHAEDYLEAEFERRRRLPHGKMTVTDAIGASTVGLAGELDARLIVTLTSSGHTARMVARHRPDIPILAVTVEERIRRRLALVWGVESTLIPSDQDTEAAVISSLEAARKTGLVQRGERVVITAGVPAGIKGQTNMVQVRTV